MKLKKLESACLVQPGSKVRLRKWSTRWKGDGDLGDLRGDELEDRAKAILHENQKELAGAQELLWASDTWSVLVVLQGMDTSGKDSTIKHVMAGVNPQGCEVHSFKRPSAQELDHNFLWRYARALPERGKIGIFNRSHYEEVLVVKVHPELLASAQLPESTRKGDVWNKRYADINSFEHHLVRNGTLVVKFFLHLSKEEQRQRLLARLDDPSKHWKFSLADLAERAHWDEYQAAYEDMLRETSTEWAPWYVIPADDKHVARAVIGSILTGQIKRLGLEYPEVDAGMKRKLGAARKELGRRS